LKTVKSILKKIGFTLLTLVLIGITTATICLVAGAAYVKYYISPTIDINLDDFRLNFTSFVYYVDKETGEEIKFEELHGSENRVWVDYEDIPQTLIDAYISVEDSRFYEHDGVDWKRTIGAMINYIIPIRDNFGGGSTITQQLIKNLTGDNETSVKRKVQEIMRALELEAKYDKDEILELYLNTIYLGQGANGVKAAAKVYFGKELDELSLVECAAIAGISKNPYKYDIIRFPEFNEERRATVLMTMRDNLKITEEEYQKALKTDVSTENSEKLQNANIEQSYFVDEVIMSVKEDLMEEKGYSEALASQLLYTGGLKIVTTLDPDVQAKMDAVFIDEDNLPGILGSDGTMPQASMVITDPYTGHVVAMYGGRGEKEGKLVLNRATRTKRSPGSSIKPLTVYAPAIEYGVITPATVMTDAPKNFEVRETGWPKNYYNYYRGQMNMMKAIEISNNPIPVEILQKMGVEKSFEFANVNLGLESLVKERTKTDTKGNTKVLSDVDYSPLAMGGLTDGVTVKEMCGAYSAFTNNGIYTEPIVYTKVYDSNGNIILDNTPESHVAMSDKTATYMLEMLTNVVTGPEGTGKKAAIKGIETAAKTGTTNDDKDRWFVGFTPYYTGVVWFGYDIPQAIKGVDANPALIIWEKVMSVVHEPLPNREFVRSVELSSVSVCQDSGLLPNEWCSNELRGSRVVNVKLANEDKPTETCPYHIPVKIDKTTNQLANQYCPEEEVQEIGILAINRVFANPGVALRDQQYVLQYVDPASVQAPTTAPSIGSILPGAENSTSTVTDMSDIYLNMITLGEGTYPAEGGVTGCAEHNADNNANKPTWKDFFDKWPWFEWPWGNTEPDLTDPNLPEIAPGISPDDPTTWPDGWPENIWPGIPDDPFDPDEPPTEHPEEPTESVDPPPEEPEEETTEAPPSI